MGQTESTRAGAGDLREMLARQAGLMIFGQRWSLSDFSWERPACLYEGVSCQRTHLGAFSYMNAGGRFRNVEIGRFCSLGDGVVVGALRHPLDWVTSMPLSGRHDFSRMTSRGMLDQDVAQFRPFDGFPERTVIGNDVWMCTGVLVPGTHRITVGNGAVIGAHAVVTKDVPAWAVVAGNPARVVRQRFPDEICADLEASGWWNYDWTACAAMHGDLYVTAPVNEPARFISWWREGRMTVELVSPAREDLPSVQ